MLYEDVKKANNAISSIGTCRFCKQQRTVEILQEWNKHEIDEAATELCDCNEATTYTYRKKRAEQANTKIKELFGEDNGEVTVSAKVVNILYEAVIPICEELAAAVSIDVGNGVKAKISMTQKGTIKVTRTKTNSNTYEC